MQFKVLKIANLIQGISDSSFGSMAGAKRNERAVKFIKSLKSRARSKDLVWAEQVFGSKVHVCSQKDSGRIVKGADGLITNIPGQVLGVVSADCIPILIFDPEKRVVAALHGARKSLAKGIVKKALSKMASGFGSDSKNILVGLGPHIRKCHYFTDITKLAMDDLLKSGVKRKNIEDCRVCTFCSAQKYFSHRRQKEAKNFYNQKRPRFAGFISLKENRVKASQKSAKEASKALKEGKVIVCPTDTVYGLLADATDKKTVKKVFEIKNRPFKKPLPVFVKDVSMAKKYAKINQDQERLLKAVWPGKTTFVLKRKKKLKLYGVDKETVALRIPDHKFVKKLLSETNRPLTGTSANVSGQPASGKLGEVLGQLSGRERFPDLIIDQGLLKSRPSKIIDLSQKELKVLRR